MILNLIGVLIRGGHQDTKNQLDEETPIGEDCEHPTKRCYPGVAAPLLEERSEASRQPDTKYPYKTRLVDPRIRCGRRDKDSWIVIPHADGCSEQSNESELFILVHVAVYLKYRHTKEVI